MMRFKPRSHWKRDCSIILGRGAGGQIRWKGEGKNGTDRFLVIVERNRGKPDEIRETATVEGKPEDAGRKLGEILQSISASAPATPGRGQRAEGAISPAEEVSSLAETTPSKDRERDCYCLCDCLLQPGSAGFANPRLRTSLIAGTAGLLAGLVIGLVSGFRLARRR